MSQNHHQLEYANNTRNGVGALSPTQGGTMWQLSSAAWTTFYWAFFALITLGVTVGALGIVTGPVFSGPGLMVAIVLVPMCATARRMIRNRRGLAVLGYVRQAVRLNVPVHRILLAAAASETGTTTRRLRELDNALHSGAPISACIAATVPEVSHRALGLILVGEQTGQLGPALDRVLSQEVRNARGKGDPSDALTFWYPSVVLLIACFVIAAIDLLVYPRFHEVMRGFHVPTPRLLEWMQVAGDWMQVLLPILACVILFFVGLRLREALTGRPALPILRRISDRILWYMPIAHGVVRDVALGDVCLAIADSLDAGYPLDEVLARMTQLDLNVVMQSRIASWADALARGMNPADAARSCGMPALLVGLLKTATANPADVFRFAGRFYERRSASRREILRSLYLPVCTILIGTLVLLVAVAIFQPMQTLIGLAGPQWFGP